MSCGTLTVADLRSAGLWAEGLTGRGQTHRARLTKPLGVIVHSPGEPFAENALVGARRTLGREPTDIELDAGAAARFDRLKYQPGYLIGVTGTVFQLDLDTQRTQHAGGLAMSCPDGDVYTSSAWRAWAKPLFGQGWARHGRDQDTVYDFWCAAFPGAASPYDVFPWRRYPNDAVGVDLLPDPRRSYGFSDAQRTAFGHLVRALAGLHGFPLDAQHVTTHALAAPCERGTVLRRDVIIGTHWDPPTKHWDHAKIIRDMGAS